MTNEHITRLEVSNFKKFDRLVVENIGQVNLITGDNNVGKTSLLEVLLLEPEIRQILSSLNFIFLKRKIDNSQNKFFLGKELESKANNLVGLVQSNKEEGIKIEYQYSKIPASIFYIENYINSVQNYNKRADIQEAVEKIEAQNPRALNARSKNWLILQKNNESSLEIKEILDVLSPYYLDYQKAYEYLPFITIENFYADDIIQFYDRIIEDVQTKQYLIEVLNNVFSSDIIIDVVPKTIQGNKILCIATEMKNEFHPITYYGDGFVRTIRIVLEILISKDYRLMIDEIETGLHFSRQKEVWKTVMKVAIENNVQLFCTTHSQDCINAFVEAAEEMSEMKDKIRLIELEEAKLKPSDRNVFASTYNFDQIVAGLNSDVNLRGGTF